MVGGWGNGTGLWGLRLHVSRKIVKLCDSTFLILRLPEFIVIYRRPIWDLNGLQFNSWKMYRFTHGASEVSF